MAQVKFSFNAKRNEDGRWSYTYDHDAKKLSFNKLVCTDSEIIFEAVLDTYDDNEEDKSKKDAYVNELSILYNSNYNKKEVSEIFKRINLTSLDFSKADDRGNINLYTFNKHTTPVYIRFGDPDKPITYSYEEVEELKEKYSDNTGDYIPPFSVSDKEIFNNKCIIAVDLVKNPIFKEHDVYFLYVVTRTMYEMISKNKLARPGLDVGQICISNFLTKQRLVDCLAK